MECCNQEMELVADAVIDEYEPFTGHKQTEIERYWFCEDCENVEPYIKENVRAYYEESLFKINNKRQ